MREGIHHPSGKPIDWKKYAAVSITVAAVLLAFWIGMRYGIGIVMPFLFAWILSLLLVPIAERIAQKTHLPKKLCVVVLLLFSIGLLAFAVSFGLMRLIREIEELFRFLGENGEYVENGLRQVIELFTKIGERIPFLSALEEIEGFENMAGNVETLVGDFLRETVSSISARIPTAILSVIFATPSVLLFLLMFLISAFYFCLDGDRIHEGIKSFLPQTLAVRFSGLRRRAAALLFRYLRVYLLIFLITFVELLIGLSILGRNYSFLMALLISALDILPVFGVGTVLIPWAALLFFAKDYFGAIGLLILWGVVTVVRQIVEPHLFGESFGIHPLFALAAIYAGLKLFGFVGILLGPAIAVFLKLVFSEARGKGDGENSEISAEKHGSVRF